MAHSSFKCHVILHGQAKQKKLSSAQLLFLVPASHCETVLRFKCAISRCHLQGYLVYRLFTHYYPVLPRTIGVIFKSDGPLYWNLDWTYFWIEGASSQQVVSLCCRPASDGQYEIELLYILLYVCAVIPSSFFKQCTIACMQIGGMGFYCENWLNPEA